MASSSPGVCPRSLTSPGKRESLFPKVPPEILGKTLTGPDQIWTPEPITLTLLDQAQIACPVLQLGQGRDDGVKPQAISWPKENQDAAVIRKGNGMQANTALFPTDRETYTQRG